MSSVIKYNPLTVSLYNAFLRSRCRRVAAYIFVATTGRSGSESLSRILAAVDGAASFHEPYPIMFRDYPPGTDQDRYFARNFNRIKRINIRRSAAGNRYYIETNHQFIKNFSAHVVHHFRDKVKIIHLVRPAEEVAGSFYSIDSIPGRTRNGLIYLLDPRAQDNLVQISDVLYSGQGFHHDYYKCLWYWYEVETRFKKFRSTYRAVPWVRLNVSDLNDKHILLEKMAILGIEADADKLEPLIGTHCNRKSSEKLQKVSREEKRFMHLRLLDRMEERYGKAFWC